MNNVISSFRLLRYFILMMCLSIVLSPSIILSKTLADIYPSNFEETMSHERTFDSSLLATDPSWQLVKTLFDVGMQTPYTSNGDSKIPQKFHLIWMGGAPPDYYRALAQKLEQFHPSCIVKIWTDDDAKTYPMQRRDAFDFATNLGEKSDIFRYEILYNEGGIYMDGDFDIFHPLTELMYACDFFAGIHHVIEFVALNGALVGTVPNHPIIKECLDMIKSSEEMDAMSIINRTGPIHFTRCFLEKSQDGNSVIIPFPVTFFYPFPNYRRGSPERLNAHLKPHSLATHLWKVAWLGSESTESKKALRYSKNSAKPSGFIPETNSICGDGWINFANFFVSSPDNHNIPGWRQPNHADVYTPRVSFTPQEVFAGATIYVATYCLDFFFKYVHPYIRYPYILISWGSGAPVPGNYYAQLNSAKIIAWFANQGNVSEPHPKFTHTPLGQENKVWHPANKNLIDTVIQDVRTKKIRKTKLLYMNFSVHTNPKEQQPIHSFFSQKPYCTKAVWKKNLST